MPNDIELEDKKDHGWRETRARDQAYARGEIDDAGWHHSVAALIVPMYLNAETPEAGSGHRGSAADWEYSRGIVAEALDRSGTFLDVGCANGLLMQSIPRWAATRGFALEPYGLDISPELAALARSRVPHWAERIFEGNAFGWSPPQARGFDFVRTGLEYVPIPRVREFVVWLLEHVVADGGRLIIGKHNEEAGVRAIEEALVAWGFRVSGRAERVHRSDARLRYRVAWIDRG